jgi:hypothetical protein
MGCAMCIVVLRRLGNATCYYKQQCTGTCTGNKPVTSAPHSWIQKRRFPGDVSIGIPTTIEHSFATPRERASSIHRSKPPQASGGCDRKVRAPASALASRYEASRSVTGLAAAQSCVATGTSPMDWSRDTALRRSIAEGRTLRFAGRTYTL